MKTVGPLLIILIIALSGQPSDAFGQTQRPTIELEFKIAPIGQTDWSNIQYEAEPGVFEDLTFYHHRRSTKTYKYRGEQPLIFYRLKKETQTHSEHLVSRTPIASIEIKKSMKEILLLFRKTASDQKKPEALKIYLVKDDHRSFPPNTFKLFNGTQATLYGKIGALKTEIHLGATAPIHFSDFIDEKADITLAVQTEEGPRLVFDNTLEFEENSRALILLTPPKRKHSLRLQSKIFLDYTHEPHQ